MKKRVFYTVFSVLTLMVFLTQSVFAITETVIIKPEYTEDTVVAISFKGSKDPAPEYIYTGEKIKPEVVVTKVDKTVADPSEYKVTYEDDCHKTGLHTVYVEYLKSGYRVGASYSVVPGTTKRVDMTAKNGSVALSWSSVKGATCYRVYEYNASRGMYIEIPWEDGSIAAPKLSRTFTNLEPGKTYNMGIMALPKVTSMPSKQMKTFKFTVPENGNGTLNIIPGINESPKTTAKPVTTVKATVAVSETEIRTTKAPITTTTTEAPTTTTEAVSMTETETTLTTTAVNAVAGTQKTEFNAKKLIPVFIAVGVAVAVAVSVVVIKKKKK